jgi:hypothetical protein
MRPLASSDGHVDMTAYKNFIEDFPRRCRDVLDLAGKSARYRGLEVTLTLMVASAGLIVPYERLKPEGEIDHPSADSKTFAGAAAKLKSLLNEPFLSSCLWNEASATWRSGELLSVTGDPDSWDGLQRPRPISKEKRVRTVLKTIRNSLAHGNIYTLQNPIQEIIFIEVNKHKDPPGYSFISVAPDEFRKFLENWFEFLNDLHVPREVAFGTLKDAA